MNEMEIISRDILLWKVVQRLVKRCEINNRNNPAVNEPTCNNNGGGSQGTATPRDISSMTSNLQRDIHRTSWLDLPQTTHGVLSLIHPVCASLCLSEFHVPHDFHSEHGLSSVHL